MRLLTALLIFLTAYAADADIVEKDVIGRGATRAQALENGFVEAIRQVRGALVDMSSVMAIRALEVSESGTAGTRDFQRFETSLEQDIRAQTAGLIDGYDILGEHYGGAHQGWEVKLRVRVATFVPVGNLDHQKRIRLALLPWRLSPTRSTSSALRADPAALSHFTRTLEAAFIQARRFNVLDRSYTSERMQEHRFVESSAPPREWLRLGESLGADYLLVGSISRAEAIPRAIRLPKSGLRHTLYHVRLLGDYRVIDSGTGQAKWANSFDEGYIEGQISVLLDSPPSSVYWRDVSEKLAIQMGRSIHAAIYPVRVAEVRDNGEIILNQGGILVKKGDRLAIYSSDRDLVDPQSGEYLGDEGDLIGVIEVVDVLPKRAIAVMREGQIDRVNTASICRFESREGSPGDDLSKLDLVEFERRLISRKIARGELRVEDYRIILQGLSSEEVVALLGRKPFRHFPHGSQQTMQFHGILPNDTLVVTFSSQDKAIVVQTD